MKKILVSVSIILLGGAFLFFWINTLDFSVLESPEDFSEWKNISSIYEKKIYTTIREDAEIKIHVYKVPMDAVQVSLYESIPPKSFLEWEESTEFDVLINSGYFLEDYTSVGALSIDGISRTQKQLDFDRTGLILIDNGTISLVDTAEVLSLDEYQQPSFSYLQSYPFLINGGVGAIEKDSELLARRTVIATSTDHELLIIFVDQTPVSLYELMEILLHETDLSIDMALNLDGGPSSGLLLRLNEYEESFYPLTSIPQILTISQLPLD